MPGLDKALVGLRVTADSLLSQARREKEGDTGCDCERQDYQGLCRLRLYSVSVSRSVWGGCMSWATARRKQGRARKLVFSRTGIYGWVGCRSEGAVS